MTMTSKVHPYKTGHGAFRARRCTGRRSRTPIAARPRVRRSPRSRRMFVTHVAPSQVAAIVFEPQLGEGGFVPAPPAFVEGLRRICDRHGIMLVADEVQTGFGRTGRMFAMEHYGVEADLIMVAKSIAAGLPLSGVIGKAEIMDAPHAGAIGGTFIGNPVALAAALAVLDVFAEEDLVARANAIGDPIRQRMLAWQQRWPRIGDVRGLGAMLAIELVRDPATKEPAPELAAAVIDAALERGLILLKAGSPATASGFSARSRSRTPCSTRRWRVGRRARRRARAKEAQSARSRAACAARGARARARRAGRAARDRGSRSRRTAARRRSSP